MRKLQTQDIFNTFRIIKRANLKNEVKPLLDIATKLGQENAAEIGVTAFMTIFDGLAEKNAEQAIYDFLAGPFEMRPEEVASLDLDGLLAKIEQLAGENDLKTFFTRLGGLIGMRS